MVKWKWQPDYAATYIALIKQGGAGGRYDKVMSQGKKNEIIKELEELQGMKSTCGHGDHKFKSTPGGIKISMG